MPYTSWPWHRQKPGNTSLRVPQQLKSQTPSITVESCSPWRAHRRPTPRRVIADAVQITDPSDKLDPLRQLLSTSIARALQGRIQDARATLEQARDLAKNLKKDVDLD